MALRWRAATSGDRIFKDAKLGNLTIEEPTKVGGPGLLEADLDLALR